jgi:hypothetical protein
MPQTAEMLTLQAFQGDQLHYQRDRELWQGGTTKSGTAISAQLGRFAPHYF